ncbi:MAG: hypothetical protein JST85_19620 [Acidobacteria bacterium]|nr:hypothetical protein [Acidobacteriota bacterium]
MPTDQMIAEMNEMTAALMFVANLIGIVAFSIFAVYLVGLVAVALSEKLAKLRRPSLPKIQIAQAKPSATRTVLQ